MTPTKTPTQYAKTTAQVATSEAVADKQPKILAIAMLDAGEQLC